MRGGLPKLVQRHGGLPQDARTRARARIVIAHGERHHARARANEVNAAIAWRHTRLPTAHRDGGDAVHACRDLRQHEILGVAVAG